MKKLILAGIVSILAIAVVMTACDGLIPPEVSSGLGVFAEEELDNAGNLKALTINLNGGDRSIIADRSLSGALANLNHNFFEVVFYYTEVQGGATGAKNISRTSWTRGSGASLDVFRGNEPSTLGIDYGSVDFGQSEKGSSAKDIGAAILFVGTKDNNGTTLLAVGKLANVANNAGTYPSTPTTTVTSSSSKVKFEIVSLSASLPKAVANLGDSSFFTRKSATSSYDFDDPPTATGEGPSTITALSTNSPGDNTGFGITKLHNLDFPAFIFGSDFATTPVTRYYAAKFKFDTKFMDGTVSSGNHTIDKYIMGIMTVDPAAPVLSTHKYAELRSAEVYTGSTTLPVYTDLATVAVIMENNKETTPELLNNEAYFMFTVPAKLNNGYLALHFAIPVYAITDEQGTGGIDPILWQIKPGIASYLDSGTGLGGSILIAIGTPGSLGIDTGHAEP